MSTTFKDLADQVAAGPDIAPDIPDSWKQGRTAYGGLTAALMLAGARRDAQGGGSALPPLRSALINFTGPVTGPPALVSRTLRRGRNVITVEASAGVDGDVVATAVFSFGGARESSVRLDCPAPDAPAPDDCPPFMPPEFARFAPGFFGNFEVKMIEGDRPVSGAERGYIRAWARHADPASREGEASLLCLADVLPPATMPMLSQPGPVSSMSWICNLLREPKTQGGWFMVEAELSAARDGYSSQVMRIWNRAGELIVEGMQSIVIFA